jgi:hypothetical protein
MLKLYPITLLLGVTLLFGQGGVAFVAALCPHLSLAAPRCDMPEMQSAMDHSQEPCSHCVIHSRSNAKGELVRTAETVKRSADLEAPVRISFVPIAPVAVLTPREHGPPGKASRPKHVLINTFRI